MKRYQKQDYPADAVRRYLEPGPIVLVSSSWQGQHNIMTMGWHMMIRYQSLACYIWDANHSFDMLRNSEACVINLPTVDIIDTVVDIGNCSGTEVDKFARFGLTAKPAEQVDAPLIDECYANFECRLADASQIDRHGLFIWDIVKAHVAVSPRQPKTVHYQGDGEFMVAGDSISRRGRFKPEKL